MARGERLKEISRDESRSVEVVGYLTKGAEEKFSCSSSASERAVPAAHLLGSLPSVLHDEDEGIAKALRRDAEFEVNPSLA